MGSVWEAEDDDEEEEVRTQQGRRGVGERVGKGRHFPWTETGCRGSEWGDPRWA